MSIKERRTCVNCVKPEKTWLGQSIIFSLLVPSVSDTEPVLTKVASVFVDLPTLLMQFEFTLPASSLEAAELGVNPQVALETNYCHSYL